MMVGSMCSIRKAEQDFVAPRRYSSRARPRHEAVHIRDALRVIERASTPGTGELSTSLCTQSVHKGYRAPKSRQEDPFLQKLLAAKNLNLERLPFRDAYLFQYGVLPEQYKPPRDDHAISLHPCDNADAKRPESLVQTEANTQQTKGQPSSPNLKRRAVLPWDGTMKNVTAPLLWRDREPLF